LTRAGAVPTHGYFPKFQPFDLFPSQPQKVACQPGHGGVGTLGYEFVGIQPHQVRVFLYLPQAELPSHLGQGLAPGQGALL